MKIEIFNSPIDVGLRILFLLKEIKRPLSLQSIIYLDYLLLHSGEILNAPSSINESSEIGSGEILIKREVTRAALSLMHQNQLLDIELLETGVYYSSNKLTVAFIKNNFTSNYSLNLTERAKWLNKKFKSFDERKLKEYVSKNISKWDIEFDNLQKT
jgi:hypothetical protein